MTYKINYDEAGFIRLFYEGDADLRDVREVIAKGVSIAQERNCFRVLSDFRSLNLKLTAADIFSIPLKQIVQSRELDIPYYKFRRTMVVPEADYDKYKFFENVAVNRSHVIKIFTDIEDAISWLLDGDVGKPSQSKADSFHNYKPANTQPN